MDGAVGRWVYEFGEFRLDAGRRLLSRVADGARIAVSPKVLDACLYLVERAGDLVPKSRLLADLWPGMVVEENSLTQVVCDLRRALGESRGENRYVVTVPRRGYQFVAEVSRVLLVRPSPAVPDLTVAVLQFEHAGHGDADGLLATGIPDGILHRLAPRHRLRLVSHTSSFAFRGQHGDARVIGRTLGARYLVEGSVQQSGSRVRISAQLIDAADGSHLWSMMFDRAASDVFAVEDDVSLRVARALCDTLLHEASAAGAELPALVHGDA